MWYNKKMELVVGDVKEEMKKEGLSIGDDPKLFWQRCQEKGLTYEDYMEELSNINKVVYEHITEVNEKNQTKNKRVFQGGS
jgi:hypothetical protein